MKNINKKSLILLVSENKEIYSKIYEILESNNYKVITANSSSEALSSITYELPSLIISDSDLPDDSGYNFCKKIRASIKTKLIPFIFFLDSDEEGKRIQAIQGGADAYLIKPINAEELLAHVKSKLNQFNEFYLLTITDELTRLFNRREFLKKFNEEVKDNPKRTISLAILDLDFFKQINDIHGHQAGDIVLMKLAELLKNRYSDNFFPTRFGGEEFVILFPDINLESAKLQIEDLKSEFKSVDFRANSNRKFNISFSAGISEYPSYAKTLSLLLSRADQALYAAKNDGRDVVYTFNPVMARNDSFWKHLKQEKGFFVIDNFYDAVTGLPFLPLMLEEICNFEFEISSIGAIIFKLDSVFDMENFIGHKINDYSLQNIKFIIQNACHNHFASDTYIAISDIFNYEFIILFPSIADFAFNPDKCNKLYQQIANEVKNNTKYYCTDLNYSSSILYYKKDDPKKLLKDIKDIRNNLAPLTEKRQNYINLEKDFVNNLKENTLSKNYFKNEFILDIISAKIQFQFLSINNISSKYFCTESLFNNIITDKKILKKFVNSIKHIYNHSIPIIFPYISSIDIIDYTKLISKLFKNNIVYISIPEYSATKINIETWDNLKKTLSKNIKICINHVFIGNNILNLLSRCDFDLIIFSDHLTNDIHYFRNRIKIINGFKVFIDQMGIKSVVENIEKEEEYHLIKDLNFKFMHGNYITKSEKVES